MSRRSRGRAAARAEAFRIASEAHGHTHRDLTGGGLRAAMLGVSDGLVSNVSLVLGTAGVHPGAGFVRLAGLAGLLGGSFSMAAGEYVSMRGQREAFEHELEIERQEIAREPESERLELEGIYVRRGIAPEIANELSHQIMEDADVALITHAREELGVDPGSLGSPLQAALSSFWSFALGAFCPLVPYLVGAKGSVAIFLAIAITGAAAIAVGTALAYFTSRPRVLSALRSLAICAVAGAVTFGIGSAIGVSAR